MTSDFKAPLAPRLVATSVLGTVVLLGESALMLALASYVPRQVAPIFLGVAVSLVALLGGIALVAIRGYRLEVGVLRVDRPLWSTTHSLAGLLGAARDPHALRVFTLRGFGNNGFFALNGWRYVAPHGWCRVLATNPENAVVLRTAERTLIVTPERPDEFVQQALLFARSGAA
ncbi:MAG: PH domain-containing protein [Myxococcota bacterium]